MNPTMPTSRSRRRLTRLGAIVFVSHAYPPYIHHRISNSSPTRSIPSGDSSWTSTLVSWVTANTKTRSKKSSRVVTRSASCWTSPGPERGSAEDIRQWSHFRGGVPGRGRDVGTWSIRGPGAGVRVRGAADPASSRVEGSVTLPASDWCQRWESRQHSWRHRSEGGFDAARYDVAPLIEADARTFIQMNHYSASTRP